MEAERIEREKEVEKERRAVAAAPRIYAVIIDVNLDYPGGRTEARKKVEELVAAAVKTTGGLPKHEGVNTAKSRLSQQYLFCRLSAESIRALVQLDRGGRSAAEGAEVDPPHLARFPCQRSDQQVYQHGEGRRCSQTRSPPWGPRSSGL